MDISSARFACRSLLRRRTYALIVVVMLGLGIGVNTAMFGVIDAVLLRALPYRDSASLVVMFADGTARAQGGRLTTTPGDLWDWRARSDAVFSGIAALRNVSPRITNFESPLVPLTQAVTANYFDVLGAAPILGRGFRLDEDTPGRDGVVVLSYGLWQAKLGGDPAIVGRTLDLDGRPHTVIGVMGPDFYSAHFYNVQPDLWIPRTFDLERDDRATRGVLAYGRLRPTISLDTAQAAVRAMAAGLAREHPTTNDRWSIALVPIRDHAVGGFTRLAALVLSAVSLVLLIACANVANLALARGLERTGDVAVRLALGASRGRVIGELLIESLVLATLGGVLGTVIAWWGMPLLVHLIPVNAGVPFLSRASIDWRVLSFELAITMACALLSGLLPAAQTMRLDVVEGLRGLGRSSVSTPAGRWRRLLVAGEVALAVIVVACAMLMTRSLIELQRVPSGFRQDRIAKLRTSLRGETFSTRDARIAHFDELQRRLATVPAVTSVSGVSFEPPTPEGQLAAVRLRLPGTPEDSAALPSAVSRVVLANYFETMGLPILSGRGITRTDRADTARVAVISATMARRYFAGVDPIGRTFSVDQPGAAPVEIVGIAGDVLTEGIDPTPQPVFYLAYAQNALPVMTIVMRVGEGSVSAPLRQAEQIAWAVSPFTNVYFIETMEQHLADLNWRARFAVTVLGGFAALALLLAAAGLYAVMSHGVVQRRREIALRMALGADARAIIGTVLGEGMRTVLAGLVIGNLAGLLFTRALTGLLYGVAPNDPATVALVSLAVLAVAACACAAPAIRAARTDPHTALGRLGGP